MSTFRVSMQLGASIGRSVRNSFQSTQGHLQRLGSSIQTLKTQQRNVRRFSMESHHVDATRRALLQARAELRRFNAQTREGVTPTRAFQNQLSRAQNTVERLSQKLTGQHTRLERVRTSLKSSGVSTRDLSSENERLGRSLDRLQTRYQTLNAVRQRQTQRAAQRSELRGQAFDTVAVGLAVAAPIRVAVDFEARLSKLDAIVGDAQRLGELQGLARSLGESTLFSASQVVEAMTFLGMAGFDAQKILGATAGVLDLAQASGLDLAQSADIASNILSGFSLEAKAMGRVGDVLTATFTGTNTTLSSLGETMKFVAPVAAAVGAEIEEVAALTGLLGDSGIQGSRAGTALRATYLRLSAPVGAASEVLSNLGVTVKDLDGNLRPVPIILGELADAMSNLGSAQQAGIVKTIFGEEAASGVTKLLEAAGKGTLNPAIDALKDSDQLAKKIAQKMANNTQGSFRLLGSALESVAISLGSTILPALTSLVTGLAKAASVVSRVAQRFPTITKVVIGLTVGLIALRVVVVASIFTYSVLGSAVGSLTMAYTVLSGGLSLARGALSGFQVLTALSAVKLGAITAAQWAWNIALTANPIGLIIVGVGALIGASAVLIKHWGKVKTFFVSLWQGIKTLSASTIDWLVEHLHLLLNPVALLVKLGGTLVGALFPDKSSSKPSSASSNSESSLTHSSSIGTALGDTQSLPLAPTHASLPDVAAADQLVPRQDIRIDAPISIHADPGMDEQMIAQHVQQHLERQHDQAQRSRRVALFDLNG